jgi:multicomponent K+:H+ antiporter subunit G
MSGAADIHALAALLTAILLVAGAAITLIGTFGLVRLQTFYQRVHAP